MAARRLRARIVIAVLAALAVSACLSGNPDKVYDYSKAGFTPDHAR